MVRGASTVMSRGAPVTSASDPRGRVPNSYQLGLYYYDMAHKVGYTSPALRSRPRLNTFSHGLI